MRRGGLTLLETHTAYNSAQLDFVNWYRPELFDQYQIRVTDVLQRTTGADIYLSMRCSYDGGAFYDIGSKYSWVHSVCAASVAVGREGANATNYLGLITLGSTNLNWGGSGVFHFTNIPGLRYKQFYGTAASHSASRGATDAETSNCVGAYMESRPVNALRFFVYTGAVQDTIVSGTIRIYGVAK
jgi:hypothetical protein